MLLAPHVPNVVMLVVLPLMAVLLISPSVVLSLETDERGVCDVYPDPHFRTWDNIYYDYHGGVDLVLCNGNVVDVHIRTAARFGWSAIVGVAVHFHERDDTLEVEVEQNCCPDEAEGCCDYCCQSGQQGTRFLEDALTGGAYYINGVQPDSAPRRIGGYPLSVNSQEIVVDMGGTQSIKLALYGGSVRVLMSLHGSVASSCQGMCGHWKDGGLRLRDGSLVSGQTTGGQRRLLVDQNLLGEDWQVLPDEPKYFRDPGNDEPEYISGQQQTRLIEQARAACQPAKDREEVFQNCVDDILNTGDVDTWRDAPRYNEPEPAPPVGNPECRDTGWLCALLGGECKYGCDKNENRCWKWLCPRARGSNSAKSSDFFFGRGDDDFAEGCSCAIPRG